MTSARHRHGDIGRARRRARSAPRCRGRCPNRPYLPKGRAGFRRVGRAPRRPALRRGSLGRTPRRPSLGPLACFTGTQHSNPPQRPSGAESVGNLGIQPAPNTPAKIGLHDFKAGLKTAAFQDRGKRMSLWLPHPPPDTREKHRHDTDRPLTRNHPQNARLSNPSACHHLGVWHATTTCARHSV